MAASNQGQALQEMGKYLKVNKNSYTRFVNRAHRIVFPKKVDYQVSPWSVSPSEDLARIHLTTHFTILSANVKVYILKEAIGLGPNRYCIVFSHNPGFYSYLKMVMSFLPQEKMFFYPAGTTLGGPFLVEPWLSRGRALCSRPSLTFDEFHDAFDTRY